MTSRRWRKLLLKFLFIWKCWSERPRAGVPCPGVRATGLEQVSPIGSSFRIDGLNRVWVIFVLSFLLRESDYALSNAFINAKIRSFCCVQKRYKSTGRTRVKRQGSKLQGALMDRHLIMERFFCCSKTCKKAVFWRDLFASKYGKHHEK